MLRNLNLNQDIVKEKQKILKQKMSSGQKQNHKSTKFNYLQKNSIKQQLLGRYETLNVQPSIYRRNYDVNRIENKNQNKQNIKENVNQDFIDESKSQARDNHKKFSEKSQVLNQRLVSFRQNRPQQQKSKFLKQRQDFRVYNKSKIVEDVIEKDKMGNAHRIRNKSFGNISYKKKAEIQNSQNMSNKKNGGQFSPYQEQKRLKQILIEDCSNNFKFIQLQKSQENFRPRPQQKLLIYELQQQQIIIKKQLKQFEYQNQLLRQKIGYLQGENLALKKANQQHKEELEYQQIYYQQLLDTQSLNIVQLQQQIQMLNQKDKKYETIINQDKFLIKDLQTQIETLNSHVSQLQALLDSKQQLILQLKTKIQLSPLLTRQSQCFQTNFSKRRKSLDLSTNQCRKSPIKEHLHDSNINDTNYLLGQSSQFRTTLNTSSIGKLMKKTLTPSLNTIQETKLIEKQTNFIQSIKSMYFKIANKQTKDLKQLWKWLKSIAHQYQLFIQLYSFKESILAVLDDFQTRKSEKQSQKQLSFMQEECYKIVKKLSDLVTK